MRGCRGGGVVACAFAASQVSAQDAGVTSLPPVVAVGEALPKAAPASLDRVDTATVPARTALGVSELLQRVPGVVSRDRQNLAQDVQVTISGFGERTTYGVRGLRIFVERIPALLHDGQGHVAPVTLAPLAAQTLLCGGKRD